MICDLQIRGRLRLLVILVRRPVRPVIHTDRRASTTRSFADAALNGVPDIGGASVDGFCAGRKTSTKNIITTAVISYYRGDVSRLRESIVRENNFNFYLLWARTGVLAAFISVRGSRRRFSMSAPGKRKCCAVSIERIVTLSLKSPQNDEK